jgi:hypothetical protein
MGRDIMDPTASLSKNDLQSHSIHSGDPWRILLIELVHLLSLFLTHARHAKGSHATVVLFDQIVRRLSFLEKMPGHDGGMIIRRIGNASKTIAEKPDYFFLFGNQAFRGSDAFLREGKLPRNNSHFSNALDQAFGCLYENGIFALYLELPGQSIERIDHLRLTLNILARFRSAVENNASITFRYFGRAMTVPLIHDFDGRPDPNLTVVAGLNGLSSINMRKLIKQAMDFFKLAHAEDPAAEPPNNTYNQIFSVRSLRSQLIQPPAEINNLPWMQDDTPALQAPDMPEGQQEAWESQSTNQRSITASTVLEHSSAFDLSPAYLRIYLSAGEENLHEPIDRFFAYDYNGMDPHALASHISLTNFILFALEKGASDPAPMERFLSFLHERLTTISDSLTTCLSVQRRAIKITIEGRTTLVGMVHPRLLDLVALVKERMTTKHKIAAARNLAFASSKDELMNVADAFALNDAGSSSVLSALKSCFDDSFNFDRNRFEKHLDAFAHHADSLFEMLWCILRYVPLAQDRFAILDVLPLLVDRLKDRKATLSFLLSDLSQAALQVEVSDRNAFCMSTQMLRTQYKERNKNIRKTPEDVLSERKNLNQEIVEYAAWRMDMDVDSIPAKFEAIRNALHRCGQANGPTSAVDGNPGFHFLLTLEREGLIFVSLAGGKTAQMVLRRAFDYYTDLKSEMYQNTFYSPFLFDIMSQLRIVLRGMVRLGEAQDLDKLKALEQSSAQLLALDADPTFVRRVKQTLQWVATAIRSIQARLAE